VVLRRSLPNPSLPSGALRQLCWLAALGFHVRPKMQGIAFYAELLSFLSLVISAPSALYCLLNALLDRDFKMLKKILLALALWIAVFFLWSKIVPGGEVRAVQYTGIAGMVQILFLVANVIFLRYFLKILRQQ
jgi:hypothetical protein